VNLDPVTYWSLLREVAMLIGNSSSGIMEAASFSLPVVNIGFRQKGRERARNILDAEPEVLAIRAKITEAARGSFRESLAGMTNPYGDGHAAEKILQVLTSTPLNQDLIVKRAVSTEDPIVRA
jgi:UDP-N-acetylglucosamine 2-epimerase